MTKSIITYILLTLNCIFSFGQKYSDEVIQYFNNQLIEFNETKARQNLNENKIVLLVLISNSVSVNPQLTNEQTQSIENRFGFSFEYIYFDIPQEFLNEKQEEFNKSVYKYLDSINNRKIREEIEIETIRFVLENRFISQRTDRELKKIVRKEFRKTDRQLREKIFQAEKHYRNREFNEALRIYNQVEKELSIESAKKFIYNSKYHSLMNLEKYNEAFRLVELDNNNWINKRIKR